MYVRIYVYMYSNCIHTHICVFIDEDTDVIYCSLHHVL